MIQYGHERPAEGDSAALGFTPLFSRVRPRLTFGRGQHFRDFLETNGLACADAQQARANPDCHEGAGFDLFVDLFAAHLPIVSQLRRRDIWFWMGVKVPDLAPTQWGFPEWFFDPLFQQ
jgi:hypothetical protein